MIDNQGEILPQRDVKVGEVQPIERNRSSYIKNRAEIREYVEIPLVPACETFYDKNVRTLSTTANFKDAEYDLPANIIIDFDSLSPENQEIAKRLGKIIPYDGINAVLLEHKVFPTTSVGKIREWASSLATEFKKQPMTWAITYTQEEIIKWSMEPSWKNLSPEEIAEKVGYFYDKEGKVFYLSEEHYHKVKELE